MALQTDVKHGGFPGWNLTLGCFRVNELNDGGYSGAYRELGKVSKASSCFPRQTNDIILADWNDLDGKGVLVVVNVVVWIVERSCSDVW